MILYESHKLLIADQAAGNRKLVNAHFVSGFFTVECKVTSRILRRVAWHAYQPATRGYNRILFQKLV